jgi:NAD(P)-dependent dehydrogenase (short-subunit alcohol dehydrogenase family)
MAVAIWPRVVDVAASRVEAVVKEISAAGGTAHGIVADLTKDDDSRRIVWEARDRFKGLDFVWNHVGHPGPAAVEGVDMETFELAIDLNLRTVLVTTEAAIPEMRARGGGSLLFTASTSGLQGSAYSRCSACSWRAPIRSRRPGWTPKTWCVAAPVARCRWAAPASPRKSPTPRSSCCPTRPRSSPAPPCRWTEG